MTKKSAKSPLTVISLFSGAGGLDLGLEAAGFETRFATDVDFHSCETLKLNQSKGSRHSRSPLKRAVIHQADVASLSGKALLSELSVKAGEVDLLAGGPPCQAFSVFGKRLGEQDPRGRLVHDYTRLLADIRPKAFVLENVFGMLTVQGGAIMEALLTALEKPRRDCRYELSVHRVNAMDYGVPQHRDRVFIIGSLHGAKVQAVPPVCGHHSNLSTSDLLRYRTVKDGLRGLPSIGHHESFNHTGRVHSPRIVKRYSEMTPGERDSFTRINKLDLSRPSYTIIVGSDKGGGKGHVHPTEPREVTPRESARFQTFPDWWEFSGTGRHVIRQVGNAVPPLLGFAIGTAISKSVFERQAPSFKSALDFLGQNHLFPEFQNGHAVAS